MPYDPVNQKDHAQIWADSEFNQENGKLVRDNALSGKFECWYSVLENRDKTPKLGQNVDRSQR